MFDDMPVEATPTAPDTEPGEARVNRAVRNQVEMVMRDLDSRRLRGCEFLVFMGSMALSSRPEKWGIWSSPWLKGGEA